MSEAKRSVLSGPGSRWLLRPEAAATPADLASGFGRVAPLMVDIGGGTGEASLAWAVDHPDHDLLAVEVHRPGLARLVSALEAGGPPNVRMVEIDAIALIAAWPPGSVAQVRALFPDPWPKRRHIGRRLVEPGFVRRVADLLRPGGVLHLATDWPDYADQMRASVATEARLRPQVARSTEERSTGSLGREPVPWRSDRPDRPVTTYERRGIAAGRSIDDLVVHRTG